MMISQVLQAVAVHLGAVVLQAVVAHLGAAVHLAVVPVIRAVLSGMAFWC